VGARMAIGASRCAVIEILNDIFVAGLGISLLESIVSSKDGVEFSILPAYSGYNGAVAEVRASHLSVKSVGQADSVKGKITDKD
jgi:hypothetical protein